MTKFIIRRVIQALPVIWLITVVSFLLMQQAPGGPQAAFNQNPHITPAQVDAWLARWCLVRDAGIVDTIKEYLGWLGVINCSTGTFSFISAQGWPNFLPTFLGGGTNGVIHGDFGYSISSGQPVLDLITQRIPATFILMGTAWILWVAIATFIGVLAAVKRYSATDQTITIFSYIFYSLPTFWLGLILIFIFAVELRWFPAQGIVNVRSSPAPFATDAYWKAFAANPWPQIYDIGTHLILPVVTLIAVSVAGDSRFVRSAMLESLSQDYVRTARAKGLPGRTVIYRHAFRNALLPIVTNIALEIAFLFGGAIATETVFSWPGMGLLFYDGVNQRDYFLLMGLLLIGSLFIVFMNLVADVLYVMVDPRIKYD
jgi:peptide/nickel transport system permease protein